MSLAFQGPSQTVTKMYSNPSMNVFPLHWVQLLVLKKQYSSVDFQCSIKVQNEMRCSFYTLG